MAKEYVSPATTNTIKTETDAAARLAALVARPIVATPGEFTRIVVPTGAGSSKVESFDNEFLLGAPRRKTGHVTLHDVESFLDYAGTHWADGAACYVDMAGPRIVAILNGHAAETAGWGDHRATLSPRLHREWQAWSSIDSAGWISQSQLAEFVAEWLHTIVDPDGATLLELAQFFEATVSASFQAGARLASGARQLVYTEDVAAKSGEMEIPESLTTSLRVMEGDDPVEMKVWLRFRVRDGQLAFRLLRDRAADILEASLTAKAELVAESLEPVYIGSPAS